MRAERSYASEGRAIRNFKFVMAGLVPAIHAFLEQEKGVDARHEAGHDVERLASTL